MPSFEEGLRVFRDYFGELDRIGSVPVGRNFRIPAEHGDEHEVWFEKESVIKLTYPDFFGLRVVYREDEDKKCLPCEYFERWVLHNEIFGDNVAIPCAFETAKGLRVALVQKAIKGVPAELEEIRKFFLDNGWSSFQADGNTAWFDKERELVVSDTHRGNLIKTEDGTMVPIDFRIQAVSGAMLDAVKRMIGR
ncbi:MAG: hypothetical protein V4733_05005 [Verrucomicrobiota bacterium]